MKHTMEHMKKLAEIVFGMDRTVIPLMVLRSILQAVIPFGGIIISGSVIDQMTAGKGFREIGYFAVGACFVVLLLYLLENLLDKLCTEKKNMCVRRYETLIARHTLHMKYEYLESDRILGIRARIREDSNWGYGLHGMFSLFERFMEKICAMAVAAVVIAPLLLAEPAMLAESLLLFGTVLVAVMFSLRVRKKAYDRQMAAFGEVEKTNRLIAFFTNDISYRTGKDIRLYQAQELINEKGAGAYFAAKKEITKNIGNVMGRSDGYSGLLTGISGGAVYLMIAVRALRGRITIGKVVTYAGAIHQFINALSDLVVTVSEIRVHSSRFISTFEYLDIPVNEEQDTSEVEGPQMGRLELQHVSFSYPGNEKKILKDISLTVEEGEHVAIVGVNGSGKSTFIKLLCRLYQPVGGKILLNGRDINELEISNYRKLLSVVFQDFSLFAIPVADNICAGEPLDEERAWQAVVQAGLSERISSEDRGIHTPVFQELYENGIEVSGGEAQKIALARAIYRDAPLLILDEPTAALDPLSEAELYQRFSEIAKDKTAIFISHRLASCKFCSKIIVFDGGSVVQCGSHEELMRDPAGKYYALWNAQAEYYH